MAYVPDRGDAVWLSFNPQAGHEQAGRRPVAIVWPPFLERAGLVVVVPFTTRLRTPVARVGRSARRRMCQPSEAFHRNEAVHNRRP